MWKGSFFFFFFLKIAHMRKDRGNFINYHLSNLVLILSIPLLLLVSGFLVIFYYFIRVGWV